MSLSCHESDIGIMQWEPGIFNEKIFSFLKIGISSHLHSDPFLIECLVLLTFLFYNHR